MPTCLGQQVPLALATVSMSTSASRACNCVHVNKRLLRLQPCPCQRAPLVLVTVSMSTGASCACNCIYADERLLHSRPCFLRLQHVHAHAYVYAHAHDHAHVHVSTLQLSIPYLAPLAPSHRRAPQLRRALTGTNEGKYPSDPKVLGALAITILTFRAPPALAPHSRSKEASLPNAGHAHAKKRQLMMMAPGARANAPPFFGRFTSISHTCLQHQGSLPAGCSRGRMTKLRSNRPLAAA